MRLFLIILILIYCQSETFLAYGPCPPTFSTKCFCGETYYNGVKRNVTSCTDTNFQDASLLANLPVDTEVLIFTGNNISALPVNIFGNVTIYEDLKIIDMSNNNIQEIKGKTFHRAPIVELLILNHNSIVLSSQHPRIFSNFVSLNELHLTNAFLDNIADNLAFELHNVFVNSSLTRLIKLHLEQNEITEFKDTKIFCDLPNLMDLHLGNNRLSRIDFQISCLKHLRFIDLESNRISHFTNEDLYHFDYLPNRGQSFCIDIDNNPIPCNCESEHLFNWLFVTKTNVTVKNKDKLRCVYSNGFANISDTLRNFKVAQCSAKFKAVSADDNDNVFINYSLVILIFILMGCLTYIIYKQTSEHCRRNSALTNKVHYTVIGRPEEQEAHV